MVKKKDASASFFFYLYLKNFSHIYSNWNLDNDSESPFFSSNILVLKGQKMSVYTTAKNMEQKLHEITFNSEHIYQLGEEEFRLKLLGFFEECVSELSKKSEVLSAPVAETTPLAKVSESAEIPVQPTDAPVQAEAAPESTEAPGTAKPEIKKGSGRNNKATA